MITFRYTKQLLQHVIDIYFEVKMTTKSEVVKEEKKIKLCCNGYCSTGLKFSLLQIIIVRIIVRSIYCLVDWLLN